MTLADLLLPTYSNMLKALEDWLDRAAKERPTPDALLERRLAPDMFPLSAQVRFCCVQAYEAVARLRAEPFPPIWQQLVDEGRNAGAAPGTIDEAKARLRDTRTYLDSLGRGVLDADAPATLAIELPNGMIFDMSPEQYVRDWALPQFHFHLVTAYGILRHAAVPLGKADYVQHAFAYLRPGTAPGG